MRSLLKYTKSVTRSDLLVIICREVASNYKDHIYMRDCLVAPALLSYHNLCYVGYIGFFNVVMPMSTVSFFGNAVAMHRRDINLMFDVVVSNHSIGITNLK